MSGKTIAIAHFYTSLKSLFKSRAWTELRRISKFDSMDALEVHAGGSAYTDISISNVITLFITMPVSVGKGGMREHHGGTWFAQVEVLSTCGKKHCTEK